MTTMRSSPWASGITFSTSFPATPQATSSGVIVGFGSRSNSELHRHRLFLFFGSSSSTYRPNVVRAMHPLHWSFLGFDSLAVIFSLWIKVEFAGLVSVINSFSSSAADYIRFLRDNNDNDTDNDNNGNNNNDIGNDNNNDNNDNYNDSNDNVAQQVLPSPYYCLSR